MTLDNGRGYIYIGHNGYHIVSDGITIEQLKDAINK
jgi:hypothetical protein